MLIQYIIAVVLLVILTVALSIKEDKDPLGLYLAIGLPLLGLYSLLVYLTPLGILAFILIPLVVVSKEKNHKWILALAVCVLIIAELLFRVF